ncbi:MAG TPA: thymidylate kinase [Thermoplasmata archaeon]|nr:thymidylate kinase [Thermoplasmata archaeon]
MSYLIAVDGLDGCGKDTHALRMKAALERAGNTVVLMKHPSDGFFGKRSKGAVQRSGCIAMAITTAFYTLDVLASVRRLKRVDVDMVMFVRYLLGTAYLPNRLAPHAYTFFRKLLPFPDLALFIDIEPSVAIRRIETRDHAREMFETEERLVGIREAARTLVAGEWEVVDNSEDGERPFEEVLSILSKHGLL